MIHRDDREPTSRRDPPRARGKKESNERNQGTNPPRWHDITADATTLDDPWFDQNHIEPEFFRRKYPYEGRIRHELLILSISQRPWQASEIGFISPRINEPGPSIV
jgi:hypothetical protein